MSRLTIAFDRLVTFVLALACLAAGAAVLVWWHGDWSALKGNLATGMVSRDIAQSWWPWAAGSAGLVLVLVAVRWLVAHLPNRRVGAMTLVGGSSKGRLTADVGAVVSTAGDVFAETRGVRSVRTKLIRERGQRVADLRAVVEPEADIDLIARAADTIAADLSGITGRDDLYCRVRLSVAARQHQQARVR